MLNLRPLLSPIYEQGSSTVYSSCSAYSDVSSDVVDDVAATVSRDAVQLEASVLHVAAFYTQFVHWQALHSSSSATVDSTLSALFIWRSYCEQQQQQQQHLQHQAAAPLVMCAIVELLRCKRDGEQRAAATAGTAVALSDAHVLQEWSTALTQRSEAARAKLQQV